MEEVKLHSFFESIQINKDEGKQKFNLKKEIEKIQTVSCDEVSKINQIILLSVFNPIPTGTGQNQPIYSA